MFGLNLWAAPFLHAAPSRAVGIEDKEMGAGAAAGLPPPGLMMLASTAEASRSSAAHLRGYPTHPLLKEGLDASHLTANHHLRLFGADPQTQAYSHPYFSPFHPHFLKAGLDARTLGLAHHLAPSSLGRPSVYSAEERIGRRSAFSPTKRQRLESISPGKGALDCSLPKPYTPGSSKSSPPEDNLYSPASSTGHAADQSRSPPGFNIRTSKQNCIIINL